jgi:hypothetical protein
MLEDGLVSTVEASAAAGEGGKQRKQDFPGLSPRNANVLPRNANVLPYQGASRAGKLCRQGSGRAAKGLE